MRRSLAEAAREMFILVAVRQNVSAKELRAIAMKADPTKDELGFIDQAIYEYIKRRSRLNRMLTIKNELGVLKMLTDTKGVNADQLQETDVILDVGPFSYNVRIDSDKLPLIYDDLTDASRGIAFYENGKYPWSILVSDRIVTMRPEMMLITLMKGEMANSVTERHEDMHQFFAFLQMVGNVPEISEKYRNALTKRARYDELIELVAPDIILKPAKESLEKTVAEITADKPGNCTDWEFIENQARQEFVENCIDMLKSELLAFLWSCDMRNAQRRLNLVYLNTWTQQSERMYKIDLSEEKAELSSMIASVMTAIEVQMTALEQDGIKDERKIAQLMAMLNIDRSLNEWGLDI